MSTSTKPWTLLVVAVAGRVRWSARESTGGEGLTRYGQRCSSFARKLQKDVVRFWVEVVLTGFVDDSQIAFFRGFLVRKNLADLESLEIVAILGSDTECEPKYGAQVFDFKADRILMTHSGLPRNLSTRLRSGVAFSFRQPSATTQETNFVLRTGKYFHARLLTHEKRWVAEQVSPRVCQPDAFGWLAASALMGDEQTLRVREPCRRCLEHRNLSTPRRCLRYGVSDVLGSRAARG